MNYFSSDLHFGNDETIYIDDRPFKSWQDFSKQTIRTWNKQANKNDIIWIIGDYVDCHNGQQCEWEKALKTVKKFKAKVILIIGNNEEKLIKKFFNNDYDKFRDYCLNEGFYDVKQNDIIEICDRKFYLTHIPLDHKDDMLNLFGHSHRAMGVYKSFGFHIGCDVNHFRLFSEKNIKELIKHKKEYWDVDDNLKLI